MIVFGLLNQQFSFLTDYINKLGSKDQPLTIWWNIIGFGLVGAMLFGFGVAYGRLINDKLAGTLLAFFGLGFAFTAIPFDLTDSDSAVSKAHVAAITLALAFWLFGLEKYLQTSS